MKKLVSGQDDRVNAISFLKETRRSPYVLILYPANLTQIMCS